MKKHTVTDGINRIPGNDMNEVGGHEEFLERNAKLLNDNYAKLIDNSNFIK